MKTEITLDYDPVKTARVKQVSGMFDLPLTEKLSTTWQHNLPIEDKPWQIGLVVGASGAGKSVLARQAWPDSLRETFDWSNGAIIDNFPKDVGIHDITAILTGVGLGTVPAWLRPYTTLSNGERFRADMARAIAETGDDDLVVIDEFTSVVDRQVARIASNSVQKAIRRSKRKLIAVTCHYDIIDWLQPEWVYDVSAQQFTWRSVQPRPTMRFQIYQADRSIWSVFARHHYMSPQLNTSAKCFVATLDGDLCAFSSYIHFPHPKVKDIKIGHRLVVLPDYQGLGVASRVGDWLGEYLADLGYRYRSVDSHPAMIAMRMRSPRWREVGARAKHVAMGPNSSAAMQKHGMSSRRLAIRSFEFQPKRRDANT
jgi:GNAT superfamily N-acetyltransferase